MRTPDHWSLGTVIGLPVAGLILLVLLVITVGLFIIADEGEVYALATLGALFCLVLAVGIVLTYWPFDASFHRWYRVDGEVQAIGNRQISDGKAMSTRYVFRIGGEDYGVDDTRASLTKVGDMAHLMCKKEYVWNSDSGWACNWGKAQ